MRAPLLALIAASCLLTLGFAGCEAPSVLVLSAPDRVGTWERFESLAFVWDDADNPFDPAQVSVTGEFESPDGERLEMPAFATRLFERSLVGGFEKLAPRGARHWRVRFTPTAPGEWRWRLRIETPAGGDQSPWRTFTATPPAPERHGFLRVSPEDPRYLRFDDGAPYFAIGENLAWYDGRGTFAYDDWLARLAAQGVNYIRLWMPSWAFSIEWGALGDYGGRLDRAWQLDHVFEAAEAHGIYVMLCIQNHGPFSLENNTQWADNPYNVANGGPLDDPVGFFADETSRELFRRRLRYLVARWGASPNLLAWELWNELNLVVRTDRPDVIAWHEEMARELRALDPYDHLITTSVSLGDEETPLFQLPEIDLTQSHTYNWPFLFDHGDLIATFSERTRVAGKPTLIGEHGADFRGPAETLVTDPSHIAFHDGLWVGALTGTFGTAMTWWWDNLIDPEDLYGHFGAIARFVEGIAFDRAGFVETRPEASAPGTELAAYALVGDEVVLAWVKNLAHHFDLPVPEGDPTTVSGAVLPLPGLTPGAWTARWIDPYSGDVLATRALLISGLSEFAVPDFSRDVALRLERDPLVEP